MSKVRVSVPVNVCVTVDREEGEDDGVVSGKAVALVAAITGEEGIDFGPPSMSDWDCGYARAYAADEGYALINSSIEDEWEEEEEEEKEEVPNG